MAQSAIVPVAKAPYLCDGTIGFANQKTDLMGVFNSIRPTKYPYVHGHLVVFAQLSFGLGQVPFFIEVRLAATGQLVYSSSVHNIYFPNRDRVVQLAYTLRDCAFPIAGRYLIELYCNGQWVADTTLELL